MFREYAVGNKNFSTFKMIVTILATEMSGITLVYYVQTFYLYGLRRMIVQMIASIIPFWAISIISVRMGPFMRNLSIAETIGIIYGKIPRIIVSILGISVAIATLSVEINVISFMTKICINSIDHRSITVLATLVIVSYTIWGGISSITNTDILQLITFFIIIFLIAGLMFIKTGKSIFEIVFFLQNQENFKFTNIFKFDIKTLNIFLSIPYGFLKFHSNPTMIQRVYMCSSTMQVKKVFLYTSICLLLLIFSICIISLFVFTGDQTLSAEEIWNYITDGMPNFLKACIIICVLAMCMSTCDSYLHLCSIMVGHDVIESIFGVNKIPCIYKISVARLVLLIIGLLSMIISIRYNNFFESVLSIVSYPYMIFYCTIGAPLILSIFGFLGTTRTALIGMATGILVLFVYKKFGFPIGISGAIVQLFSNAFGMMVAHYVLPQPPDKGWVTLKYKEKILK
ncbi:sodium:solute symporter family protein [Candidatus Cardinium hertigii]|uniref:sodium:solute symporter family protein n=1 Tax=Candidatus Cardinium hertigii TaxID=247481 RepID=UPI003D7EAEC9